MWLEMNKRLLNMERRMQQFDRIRTSFGVHLLLRAFERLDSEEYETDENGDFEDNPYRCPNFVDDDG